jgi:hypothetical protein
MGKALMQAPRWIYEREPGDAGRRLNSKRGTLVLLSFSSLTY